MPSRVKGVSSVRKLLKRLPVVVRQELVVQLNVTGRDQLAKAQGLAPVRTGALRQGLSMKVLPASLKLRVGLVGKPINRRLFYGTIMEFGRQGQSVRAQRANSRPYIIRVRGMAPRLFVHSTPAQQLAAPFRAIWQRALARAAAGLSDD